MDTLVDAYVDHVSDRPEFKPRPDEYLYLQLADFIADLIANGVLQAGARLPAERAMVEEYGVSIGTVRRATEELRQRGLVRTVPIKGTFVVRPG